MDIKLIKIGNSRGIRLPKAIIEEAGITDMADLTVKDGAIVITRPRSSREGWEESFAGSSTELDDEDREWLEFDFDKGFD